MGFHAKRERQGLGDLRWLSVNRWWIDFAPGAWIIILSRKGGRLENEGAGGRWRAR